MAAEADSWVTTGQAEVRNRARQLFEGMLDRRPAESDWTLLRQYLSLLAELRDYEPQAPDDDLTLPADELVAEDIPDVRPEEPETQVGIYHQGLRGGKLVTEAGREIPVVERIAESAGLHHGDTVRAIFEDWFPDGRPKFFFLKVQAGAGGVNPERVEAVGFVACCSSGLGIVKVNGLEVEAPGFEFREVGAAEGDVVSVAYMQPEVRDGRVRGTILRVHESDRSELAVTVQPQRTRRADAPVSPDEEPAVQFSGRPRIMIVGGRNWPFYRDGISRFGGEPAYIDAFTNDRNLHNAVAGADIVVVITSYCSHARYDKVKAVAKLKGRLFYSTSKENWTGLRAFFEQEIIPTWNVQAAAAAD